jgi:hypothetical protein
VVYESDAFAPGTAAVVAVGVFNLSTVLVVLVIATVLGIVICRYSRRGPCEARDLEAGELRSRRRPLSVLGVMTWLAVASMVAIGVAFHVVAI